MNKQEILYQFRGNYQSFYGKYFTEFKKIGGDEYKALCPFHEEKEPSFNFNNQSGRYYCHGCGKKGDAVHFYGKLNGLDTRRDFPKILKGIASDFGITVMEQKKRTVARYVYTDEKGKPLHRTCRTEPKDFYQQHYDNGSWKPGLKGITPVLYQLPEIIKANEVLIVEGEKDCDNLAKIGFIATTCPMGAKKWRDHYNEALKGKNVVLVPDNDNQGREHMVKVAGSLNGNLKNLKFLELPGIPSKGDATDFIAQFKSPEEAAERLSMLIENVEPYEPPKAYSIDDIILNISDFRKIEIEPRRAFLKPWLKTESIGLCHGWRGMGKSFFAMGLLDAASSGKPFGPWECDSSGPSLFLDGEMTISDNHERFDDMGLLTGNRKHPLYIYSDHYSNRLGLPRAHLANESWRTKMKSILTARHVRFFVIDNIASLAPGLDENKKQDWDPINQWLLELRFAGISTLLLHHESKEGKQRGTAAREDNLDYSIRLKSPPDYVPEDGCRFIVHFAKARVRTSDLTLIEDREFKIVVDDTGLSKWTHQTVRAQNKYEVLRLLDEGMSQTDASNTLGLTRGRVSQIRNRAIKDGLLTSKNKLTQDGFAVLSEGANC